MLEKETPILLSEVLLLPDGSGIDQFCIDALLDEEISVLCINRAAEKKRIPFRALYDNNKKFWQQGGGSWEYYLAQKCLIKLREEVQKRKEAWDLKKRLAAMKAAGEEEGTEPVAQDAPKPDDTGYGDDYKVFAGMSIQERFEHLNQHRKRLDELLPQKSKDMKLVTETLVNVTKDAALINYTAFEEFRNLPDSKAKETSQVFVDATSEIVKSTVQFLSKDVFSDELMNSLVEKSNGTIIQHTIRTYMKGMAFFSYYNSLIATNNLIQRLRIDFKDKYRNFYHELLPDIKDIEDVTLERVFYGGMRIVPPELSFKWGIGLLLHDLGKLSAVEYHEGEAAYDRAIVMDHVKVGYESTLTKTNYPKEASLIVGYHHEYYGHESGYGYFRKHLQQYKSKNPAEKQKYCISYEVEPLLKCKTFAYFPAKVLEILDVYDSLTDPCRAYRKAISTEDALALMRKEFIMKQLKIDPILFDIFISFTKENQQPA
jgi:hypothetical protein